MVIKIDLDSTRDDDMLEKFHSEFISMKGGMGLTNITIFGREISVRFSMDAEEHVLPGDRKTAHYEFISV